MARPVNEVPMDEIRLGVYVVGATGKNGAIVRKRYARDGKVREDEVDILWEDGTMSERVFHSELNKVTIKE
jgi:hypothetical protein